MESKNDSEGRFEPGPTLHSSRALTLLELLAVVAIISVVVAVTIPVIANVKMSANRAKCLSNLRQIGLALCLYTNDNNGFFPPTTHTTGSRRIDQSWVYVLADYLGKIDQIRVCPADPPLRRQQILERHATSYALNELVFDEEKYNRIYSIPSPSRTLLAVILSETRTPSSTWDHVHSGEWTTWQKMLNDVQVDRHLAGSPAQSAALRTKGSSNYLYADGHVENVRADEMKKILDAGQNPAAVPTAP